MFSKSVSTPIGHKSHPTGSAMTAQLPKRKTKRNTVIFVFTTSFHQPCLFCNTLIYDQSGSKHGTESTRWESFPSAPPPYIRDQINPPARGLLGACRYSVRSTPRTEIADQKAIHLEGLSVDWSSFLFPSFFLSLCEPLPPQLTVHKNHPIHRLTRAIINHHQPAPRLSSSLA